jgi:hypothetical protein
MMVEDDADKEQCGLVVPTSSREQNMTIALDSPRSITIMQRASMLHLPATKTLEHAEMGSEDC